MADSILPDAATSNAAFDAKRLAEVVAAYGTINATSHLLRVSRATVIAYCHGRTEPRFSDVALLARATGYSLEWIATGSGSKRRSDIVADRGDLLRELDIARGNVVHSMHRELELGTVLSLARRTLTSGNIPGASKSSALRVLVGIIDKALRGIA